MEIPNTPNELFALNAKQQQKETDPQAFADFVGELASDFEPTMFQAMKAAEKLLRGVKQWHLDTIIDAGDEMHPEQLKMWKRDFKRLRKAVELITLIEEC